MTRIVLFLATRVVFIVVTLVVLSALVFFVIQWLPGDLAHVILGPEATPEQYAAMAAKLHLDEPIVSRYLGWAWNFLQGDWGHSFVLDTEVRPLVLERLRNSLALGGVALVILLPTAIAAGIVAAIHEGSPIDRLISVGGAALAVIPEFVSGVILIILFALRLRLFPLSATTPPGSGVGTVIYHLMLPALPVVFVSFGYLAKMARGGVLDVLEAPYVRTALFKGLSRWQILFRHVLRNALPPTVSVAILQAGFMMGGLVIVEQLFTYPGLGKLLLDASTAHDVETLEASVLTIGILVMGATLLSDIALVVLDPAVRFTGRRS